jgi:hypothetical protein
LAVTRFEWLNSILGSEFDQYVMEHPDFAGRIPRDAIIVLQLKGEDAFNEWARSIAERHREKDQPLLIVQVSGLKPQRSRLIRPVIARTA